MENNPLVEYDAIFQWNMSNDEVEAYKLAVCYEKEFRKIFGEEIDGQTLRRNVLPMRTDPRKSNLFRHCWKMRRETRGLMESSEYKNYIVGNLMILKIQKARVSPNVICGDKAWVRYKVWKRKFDAKMADTSAAAPAPSVSSTDPKIIQQIDRTKKFLFERCDGQPDFDKIKGFIDSGFFKFWVATGKVSQFYIALSPYVGKAIGPEKLAEQCGFSIDVVREKITEEVKRYFSHEYRHEFPSASAS